MLLFPKRGLADHKGWRLQAQTNSLDSGLGTNWTTLEGLEATNEMTILISLASDSIFFGSSFHKSRSWRDNSDRLRVAN